MALFRPSQYRQIKLALTIKESTTCFLGYGLGDVNVLTALDWSKNVFNEKHGNYPHEVIQILRNDKDPKKDPYRSNEGIIVLETATLPSFFAEYLAASVPLRKKRRTRLGYVVRAAKLFGAAEPKKIEQFIDDETWRRRILAMSIDFGADVFAEFEVFLTSCFEESKRRSAKGGAFSEYALDLKITLDILLAFPLPDFPPALLFLAAKNLNRIAPFIGSDVGYSWSAARVWNERKVSLSSGILEELRVISRQYRLGSLRKLIDD